MDLSKSADGLLRRQLQPHLLHRQQGLGVALGVVDRVMRVRRLAEVLPACERVLHEAAVQVADAAAGVAEGVDVEVRVEVVVRLWK